MEIADLTHDQIDKAVSAFLASLTATIQAMNQAPVRTRNATSFLASMEADLEKSIVRNRLPDKSAGLVRVMIGTVIALYQQTG